MAENLPGSGCPCPCLGYWGKDQSELERVGIWGLRTRLASPCASMAPEGTGWGPRASNSRLRQVSPLYRGSCGIRSGPAKPSGSFGLICPHTQDQRECAGEARFSLRKGRPSLAWGPLHRTYCRCRCYLHRVPGAGPLRRELTQAGLRPCSPSPALPFSARPAPLSASGFLTPLTGPAPPRTPLPGIPQ